MENYEELVNEYNKAIYEIEKIHSSVVEFYFILTVFALIHFLSGVIKIIFYNSVIKSHKKKFW